MTYTTKIFNLPTLAGLSEKQIKVHLGLYEGYVKSTNLIMEKIQALKAADAEGNVYVVAGISSVAVRHLMGDDGKDKDGK